VGKLVRAQELGVGHACRLSDPMTHQVVERLPAGPLDDHGQDDEAAVAVGESLVRRELRGMSVEHCQEVFGGCQFLNRNRHHVVVGLIANVLVEIVTDTRTMRKQMLDRDIVANERKVAPENGARRGGELQDAVLDQTDHCERGHPLVPTGDPEPGQQCWGSPIQCEPGRMPLPFRSVQRGPP